MATLAPISTPARQPFGTLNGSRLKSLQSVKNRQNAITPYSAPSLKRRAASPENSDSENVDPNLLDLMNKRKRSSVEDDVSLSKPRYSLTTVSTTKPRTSIPLTTPRLDAPQKPTITPASAPAAAGRSPTRTKRQGFLQPRKRFAPPSFGTKAPALSITAALDGTLANKKRKARTIEESKPKSWFFDIFEESDETQNYRMCEWTMTQSATSLDISDDESKARERSDRGKENIDPNEISVPVTRSMAAAAKSAPKVTRKDVMTDEFRTPLSDLNPVEFYAEGLDATSVVLVHEDTEEAEVPAAAVEASELLKETLPLPPSTADQDFTFQADTTMTVTAPTSASEKCTLDTGALIMASAPIWDTETVVVSEDVLQENVPEMSNSSVDIEIWESESAKDENEKQDFDMDLPREREGSIGVEDGVFALQEL